ncbi:MAG: gamma-glutamyltransferase [Planctomycetota bacterium]
MKNALGAVAAGSKESAEAAAEVFRAGGNAADAAIAAAFAAAAGDASIVSLAGGGVMVHRSAKSGECEAIDFFATAPGKRGRRARRNDVNPALDFHEVELEFGVGGAVQSFHVGRGAAAVPGVLPGLVSAHRRYGVLPIADVLGPAVRALREGTIIEAYQRQCLETLRPILNLEREGREIFFDANGELLDVGERLRNPDLAKTLERIANEGFEAVHAEIEEAMFDEFGEDNGAWLTPKDLLEYRVDFGAPLTWEYAGAALYSMPLPALGGGFVQQSLELFREADIASTEPGSAERIRRLTAAFRAVSEVRSGVERVLEQADAAALFREEFRRRLAGSKTEGGGSEPSSFGNTTHISVVDREGNAAGITMSHGEGCGHWLEGTGLHMNNILGEEDLFPDGVLKFDVGARLPTMMAPTVLVEATGQITVLGSGGANRIRTVMAQVISALLDDGATIEEAVRAGRIHVEAGKLSAETYALPGGEGTLDRARDLVDEVEPFDAPSLFFGGAHVVRRFANGELSGAGDPRRGGVAYVVE